MPLIAQNNTPLLFKKSNNKVNDWPHKQASEISYLPIKFNQAVLDDIYQKKITTFSITDLDNQEYTVQLSRVIQFKNSGWSALGFVNGDELNPFVLSYSPSTGKVISSIENVTDHSFYEIRFAREIHQHILVKKDPHASNELICGHNNQTTVQSTSTKSQPDLFEVDPAQNHGPSVIDVLILYTPLAMNWANTNSSGIDNIINQSMATAQLIADNSTVNVEFRLVHSQRIEYQETGNSLTDLRRLTASPSFNPWGSQSAGYIDEVHQIRNNYSADLVALFTYTSDVGGIAWVINSPGGQPKYGFSISRVQQAAGRTHAHEMGHNFGNAHSRDQSSSPASAGGGIFPYSTGWRWTGNNGISYASVMTYAESSVQVNYYSNPDILYQGVPAGSYEGEFSPADNTRSMNEMRQTIENYRAKAPTIEPPTVVTTAVSDISYSIAQVGGSVLVEGGSDVTNRGICWSLEQNPSLSGECTSVGSGLGSFESHIMNLHQNTQYYIRAFATNQAGTAYGEQKMFFTLELQKPRALFPATVNAVSFTARWTNVPDAEEYFLDISTDSKFNSFVNGFENREVDSGTTFFVDALIPGTDYYYRVRTGAETTQSDNSNIRQISTTDISRANSAVSFSRDRVLATGIQQSIITVTVQNSLAEPVEDALIIVEADAGSSVISPQQNTTDELGIANFAITSNTEEIVQYSITADGLNLTDDIEIEFLFSEGKLTLGNNYPNPYNYQTQIPIVVPQRTRVRLDVFNSVGSIVQTILDKDFSVGYYEIPFDASGLASGVYFYRMVTYQGVRVEKMLLAK